MEEPFLTLATLAHFLETAHFREFWDEANRNRDILEVVPGETFKPKSCVSSIVD
jgi:translation initiation factor 3 subunit K